MAIPVLPHFQEISGYNRFLFHSNCHFLILLLNLDNFCSDKFLNVFVFEILTIILHWTFQYLRAITSKRLKIKCMYLSYFFEIYLCYYGIYKKTSSIFFNILNILQQSISRKRQHLEIRCQNKNFLDWAIKKKIIIITNHKLLVFINIEILYNLVDNYFHKLYYLIKE